MYECVMNVCLHAKLTTQIYVSSVRNPQNRATVGPNFLVPALCTDPCYISFDSSIEQSSSTGTGAKNVANRS